MSDSNPFQDPFETLRKLWAPMGLPLAPLLDANDIEKRIADLKSVETWLTMNLNVLRMTIQGLEMQKATLAAFQTMQPKAGGQASAAAAPPPPLSAADAWWNLLQQTQTSPPPAPAPKPEATPEARPEKKGR